MENANKTKEQLLNDIEQLNIEIEVLKKSERQQKEVEETLRKENKLYLDLTNAQPAGIYRLLVFSKKYLSKEKWHNSSNPPYSLEFINDRYCEILKLTRQEIENNPGIINDMVLESDKTEFAEKNIESNLKTIPFLWEGRLVIKGEIRWVHFESMPERLKDGDTIWTGILYDITGQKNAALEINLKNKELNKVNAEKDLFFSIIAHDLKTPFNSIVGFSELLVEQITNKDFKESKKYADIILNSSHRAMRLLMNLMEWSLSQTGRMNFNPEYFDLANIVDEISLLCSDIAEQKSIDIKKEVHSKAIVHADKAMISTIIRNLVSNALKFTPTGGTIIISTIEKQGEVTFKIIDGIAKSSIEKLFLINEKHSTRGTQDEQGTGLGLILCKEFIDKHNGKIWAESEIGKGSTFYFTIPCKGN